MRRRASPHAGGERTGTRAVVGISLVTLVACARVLGVDDVGTRRDAGMGGATAATAANGGAHHQPETGGQGVRAGSAGHAALAGGAHGVARGGSAGEHSVSAAGGKSNGGGGEANGGGGEGGDGDDAGAPGTRIGRVVNGTAPPGTRCTKDGQFACSTEDPLVALRCAGGTWVYRLTCELDERCKVTAASDSSTSDRSASLCASLDSTCYGFAPNGPVCVDDTAYDCGPAVYTAQKHVCPFGCTNGACDLGTADDLTLHTGAAPSIGGWASSLSVCWDTTDEGAQRDAELFEWVKSEVESAYNRFLQVEFVDWSRCHAPTTGVVLSFVDGCSGYLVNDIPYIPVGTDSALMPVTLCRTYVDPAGAQHDAQKDEALVRLLARHQFAHVLGLPDGPGADPTGILRGVQSGHADAVVLTPEDYVALRWHPFAYAAKPPESIVTPTGACLAPTVLESGTTTVTTATCDPAAAEQRWQAAADQVQSSDAKLCFQTGSVGEPVTVTKCRLTSLQTFRLAHAQWRTPTRCVVPVQNPPTEGTKLTTASCTAAGDPAQAWFFESTGVGLDPVFSRLGTVRIHFGDSTLCVSTSQPSAILNDELRLAPCATDTVTGDPQIFTLNNGALMNNGNDVTWQDPAGVLYLAAPSGYAFFFASGAFEAPGGTALTLGADSTLTTTLLGDAPDASQIFDVYL